MLPDILIALVLIAGVLIGGLTKGTIGLGFPLLAVPAVALVTDPKTAVIVVSLPNLLINLVYIVQQGRPPSDVLRIVPLLIAGSLGTVVGVLFLGLVDGNVLEVLLGTMVLIYVATSLRQITLMVPRAYEPVAAGIAGSLSGFLQGTTGAGGPPLSIFLRGIGVDKVRFVYFITVCFLALNAVQLAGYIVAGLYQGESVGLGLGLTLPALAGLFLGIAVQRRIDQVVFNRVVLVALAILGLNLVLRGLNVL